MAMTANSLAWTIAAEGGVLLPCAIVAPAASTLSLVPSLAACVVGQLAYSRYYAGKAIVAIMVASTPGLCANHVSSATNVHTQVPASCTLLLPLQHCCLHL